VVKPAVLVAGIPMLDRVLGALARGGAAPIVVVGPDTLPIPADVIRAQERPPGGGPVAGVGAALDALPDTTGITVIVGGDLPLLMPADIIRLAESITDDGAVYADPDGRMQWLCGAWRTSALFARRDGFVAETGGLANTSLRAFFGPLRITSVTAPTEVAPPYFDCDTVDDIRRAEEWLRS
jgi:molybdenum cofactor guanylyltransferase